MITNEIGDQAVVSGNEPSGEREYSGSLFDTFSFGQGRLDNETHRTRNVGMKGHIGLQIHPGEELLIRFKDIQVRELD